MLVLRPHQHVGERLQLRLRIGGARRVARRVEHEPLGLGRDRRVERLGLQLVAVLDRAVGEHRLAAAEQHDVGIRHPARRRDDDLVARIERAQQRVVEHLLAAGADRHLARLVLEAVLALELGDDGRLQLRNAVDVGVLGLALAQRLDGRLLDVVGRVEVGLAGGQRDDVAAFGLQLARLRRHSDGLGWRDAVHAVGKKAHGCLVEAPESASRCAKRAGPYARCAMSQGD